MVGIGGLSVNANGNPLEPYQWQNRVLLVFYDAGNDSREIAVAPRWNLEKTQYARYENGIKDRDMLVLFVAGSLVDPLMFDNQLVDRGTLPEAQALRDTYSPEFGESRIYTSVLVGKDGGEKKRWDKFAPMEEVFAIIDDMPMRQREMRKNNYNE